MAKNKIIYGNTVLIDLTDASLGTANADKILSGETAYGKEGEKITGTCTFNADTTDATASASEILSGATAYGSAGTKITGSMPNNGAVSGEVSDKATPYVIPAGYHDGSGTVGIDDTSAALLIPGNIKSGVEILGVTGDYEGEDTPTQSKTATPYTTAQTITPDAGYVLNSVAVEAIAYTETPNQYGTTVTIGTVAP